MKLSVINDKVHPCQCYECDRCYCRRIRLFSSRWFRIYLITFLILLCIIICYYHNSCLESQESIEGTVRIMYVVRTISKYYSNRLIYLLETWIPLVHDDVYFVSDILVPNISPNHIISTETQCGPTSHSVRSLCCQTIHNFILYRRYIFNYDWFCHFDDDQYVHVNQLKKYLSTFDPHRPYYIGRISWNTTFKRRKTPYPYNFWFATLGAGVCLSKELVHLLESHTQTVSQFVNGCITEHYPDDIYLGFLINNYLNVSLTKNLRFHSHLERSLFDNKNEFLNTFHQQITFGFRLPQRVSRILPELFPLNTDPLRMRTLHCLLYTHLNHCQIIIQKYLLNIKQ